ncbi:hypothetical protein A8C56_07430 [Niabella ginsenosidivorans]|uniref:Uncharacterized protein n=1 Tax=Niabella ginsenosidivorans TaxID=1176587 RepID=A0A1A9I2M7_9BACT|nr:hypothetical protein [Niabella ginsenosidivorans]ANH80834.1 hypothetical protein A8C56_07430 [Niabella ginsenosidivorans]
MEINFGGQSSVKDVQEIFHGQYPYLKLELYRYPHSRGMASAIGGKIDASVLLKALSPLKGLVSFNTDPSQTVAGFEAEFFRKTGIGAQVVRRSGKLWLQTTDTDDLTLQQQNETGRESTYYKEDNGPEDFGLLDED